MSIVPTPQFGRGGTMTFFMMPARERQREPRKREETRNSRMTKIGWRLAILAVFCGIVYGAICIYFWAMQGDKIFEPSALIQSTPDRVGLRYEALSIASGSGDERGELSAWWIPAKQNKAPTLLYLHGNYRNISHNLEHAARLHSMGYNVLLVDYRGFGKSSGGRPSEKKVYEDAAAAWDYLVQQRQLLPQQIFIYGHSLGGAIAVETALHHGDAAGLVVESSFTSMRAMGEMNYAYLPIAMLLNQRFDSLSKIGQVRVPVLVLHGTWDARIPARMGQELYAQAAQPKFIKLIEGGEHSNSSGIASVEYRVALTDFTRRFVRWR